MSVLPRRLGARLNLLILVLLAGLGIAVGLLVFGGFQRSEQNAAASSREGIENFGEATLGSLAQLAAEGADLNLASLEHVTRSAGDFLVASSPGAGADAATLQQAPSGHWYLPGQGATADVLWSGDEPAEAVEADIARSTSLDLVLPREQAAQESVVAAYFVGSSGLVRYYPSVGLHERLPEDFDILEDPHYTMAAPERNPGRGTVWSEPYDDPAGQGLLVTVATPIYDDSGSYVGIIGLDVALDELVAHVDGIRPSEDGYAFAIGKDGALLPGESAPRINAAMQDPSNVAIGRVLAAMRARQSGTERLTIGGEDVVVGYAPVRSLGGSLALVSPVEDIAAEAGVAAVTNTINDDAERTLVFVGLVTVFLFGVAILVAAWLNRRFIASPVSSLLSATRAVAAGNLSVSIPVNRQDELGDLAASFNDMTRQLGAREIELREETRERERAEQELQALFAAMSDVVVVLDSVGTFVRIPPSNPALLLRSAEELLGRNVRDFYPADAADRFIDCVQRAIAEQATQTIEYSTPGQDIWFLGAVSPMGDDRVVWVARDITERVHSRQLLEQRVDERTRELSALVEASRNVALRLELEPLISTLLSQLSEVVEHDGSAVTVLENDELVFVDSRAFGEREDEFIGVRLSTQGFGEIWERMRSGRSVVIDDILADTPLAQRFRGGLGGAPMSRVNYARSWMGIPLQARERIVGVLSISSSIPGFFSEKHAELASAFANFAAIGIDNARLFEETRRRARQNTALARVVSNLHLAGDLQETLNAIAAEVVETAGVVGCTVIVTDTRPGYYRAGGQAGLPEGYLARLEQTWRQGTMLLRPGQFQGTTPVVVHGGRRRMLEDSSFEPLHAALEDMNVDDVVVAPLVLQDGLGGALSVYLAPGHEMSPADIAFLEAMAGQVSIVVTNFDLYNESEERAQDLELILAAADRLSSTLEFDPLVDIALDQLRLIAPHDAECIYLVNDQDVDNFYRRGDEAAVEASSMPLAEAGPLVARLLRGEVILIADTADESDLSALYHEQQAIESKAHLRDGIRACLAVPLVVTGRVIGAVALESSSPRSFTRRHRRLAQGVAYQMAVSFENARLFSETLERERETRALASVASALALDDPFEATLRAISRGVVDTTAAVACAVTLLDDDGGFVQAGGWGMPEGFSDAMARAVIQGAPSPAHGVSASGTTRVLRDVRERIMRDERYAGVRSYIEDYDWENAAVVPLPYRGRVLGTLSTFYPPGVLPSDADLALLNAIGGQAAFAVENARLFTETVDRERQTRALATVSSALMLDQPVEATLSAIARGVVETTEALACSVSLISDDGVYVMNGVAGLPDGFDQAVMKAVEQGAHSAPYEVMQSGEPQVHHHLREYFRTNPHYEPVRPLLDDVEWDTLAMVPLRYRGRALGTLTTYYEEGFQPDDEHRALLSAIAGQAAFAAENARLFEEMEERATEMAALYRADEALHRTLELEHVFQALVDVAVEVLECDKSAVMTWDSRAQRLDLRADRGFDMRSVGDLLSGALLPGGTLDQAVQGRVVSVNDAAAEPGVNQDLIANEGIRSFMHVPITIGPDVFGIFNVAYTRPHYFSAEEERLGLALSQRAAVAIQNARLYQQAQQAASLEERQRIARDLHDSVSQALYGIGLGARTARTLLERDPQQLAQPLDYILSLSEAGLAELRALIFELRPDSLETDGLVAALERQVAATRARHQVVVDAALSPEPDVSLEVKEAIYRVAQEAITNAIKHAHASTLGVTLESADGFLRLLVSDDGTGFDPGGDFPGHMGLESMRERAQRLGGSLAITSAPGEGTSIDVAIPMNGS